VPEEGYLPHPSKPRLEVSDEIAVDMRNAAWGKLQEGLSAAITGVTK